MVGARCEASWGSGVSPMIDGLIGGARLLPRKEMCIPYSLQREATQALVVSSYEVRYTGTGRLRLGVDKAAISAMGHVTKVLVAVKGVTEVKWNEISRSLLILYDQQRISSLQMAGLADEVLGGCGIHPAGSRTRELRWSLAAGTAIALSFIVGQAAPSMKVLAQALEMAGFGMTAYSVMTHRGRLLGGPKSMHLDSILAMLSVFNFGSGKALASLFLTWLVNFLEIVGWHPVSNRT